MVKCMYRNGIDVDTKGNVWLADRANHRIQKFDSHGNFIMKFGSKGSGPGQFDNPRHVVVDKQLKYVYVADSKNNRIQKFDINGTYVTSFGTGKGTSAQEILIFQQLLILIPREIFMLLSEEMKEFKK